MRSGCLSAPPPPQTQSLLEPVHGRSHDLEHLSRPSAGWCRLPFRSQQRHCHLLRAGAPVVFLPSGFYCFRWRSPSQLSSHLIFFVSLSSRRAGTYPSVQHCTLRAACSTGRKHLPRAKPRTVHWAHRQDVPRQDVFTGNVSVTRGQGCLVPEPMNPLCFQAAVVWPTVPSDLCLPALETQLCLVRSGSGSVSLTWLHGVLLPSFSITFMCHLLCLITKLLLIALCVSVLS